MKKNLIIALALVFVLGIAGTAFAAANPFVDVPAKHWAYDAVTKLAQAGILDGYGDGTYRGERLATRYEMAQATAKAMARADKADAQMKGLIDKLAVEFAAELNNLGVRVAKLEKNMGTVKFSGDSRLRYQSGTLSNSTDQGSGSRFQQRLRLYAAADFNDKASFYGRLATEWTSNSGAQNLTQNTDIFWDYGYFQWTFTPGLKVQVGRNYIDAAYSVFWTNGGYDGVQFVFGAPADKFKAKLAYGDVGNYKGNTNNVSVNPNTTAAAPKNYMTGYDTQKEVLLADVNYQINKDVSLNGAYYGSSDSTAYPYNIWTAGFRALFANDFKFTGAYFTNNAQVAKDYDPNTDPNGWYGELWFKGADRAKVGTWGLSVNYRDFKPRAIDWDNASGVFGNSLSGVNSTIAGVKTDWGVKGWGFQANYTISKNAVMTATYETLQRNGLGQDGVQLNPFYYLQLNVNF